MRRLTKFLLRSFSRAARPYLKNVGLLQTAKVFNRSTLIWEPADETVLVLAPHMDDEVIGCGGTIAKHTARGANVTVAFLTDGGAVSGTLTETRTQEAHRALAQRRDVLIEWRRIAGQVYEKDTKELGASNDLQAVIRVVETCAGVLPDAADVRR